MRESKSDNKLFLLGLSLIALIASVPSGQSVARGGVIFNFSGGGLDGGSRWDAAPRTIFGVERSLDGGLRYSLEGGTYQSFRDLFSWFGGVPTVGAFQSAVDQAFNVWTAVDPGTSLPAPFNFVSDLGTPVNAGIVGGLRLGAEIDVFAQDLGDNGTRGFSFFDAVGGPVTLTSGTTGYGGFAISGADITLNSNAGALYTLDLFRRLLTHEIGHAIGLGDVEGSINPGAFIDDDYDGTNSATAQATLNNSWSALVDPLNPGESAGLNRYTVLFADPGTTTAGVDILMESNGLGIGAGNPLSSLMPLTNDDFGTRQFLYPAISASSNNSAVPEPGTLTLCGLALAMLIQRRKKR